MKKGKSISNTQFPLRGGGGQEGIKRFPCPPSAQDTLDKSGDASVRWRHMNDSNIEILAYEPTPLGPLCLRRRELLSQPGTIVTEVTLNHEFLMSSLHTDSERALARTALQMHSGDDLRVLVGGLGLGYTAREALLSDRVACVEVDELLPQVIDWLARGWVPLSEELRDEPRLVVSEGDVYRRLAGDAEKKFDVILIDVDHSPAENLGKGNISFYTPEGLQAARRHLAPGGVLGVWSYAESSPFADALHGVFEQVRVEPITYDNHLINQQGTDWLFFATSSPEV